MRRTPRLAILAILLAAPAAAQFNVGVSPSSIVEEEPVQPGTSFHGQFFVISSSDENIDVSIKTAPGRISDLRALRPDAATNFSAQPCPDCIEFLRAGGRLLEQDQPLDDAGNIHRWRRIEFFVTLPNDIEPGYHMMEMTPRPTRAGPGGSVGLVSTAAVPLVFRVPGTAVRSGRVIGISAGERTAAQQEVVATFYNTGTVTMQVSTAFQVPGEDGNRTYAGGAQRVAPGEEARFSAFVEADRLNASTPVTATASYTTGEAAMTRPLEAKEAATVTGQAGHRPPSAGAVLFLVFFLVVSTIVTWGVVQRAR